MSEEEALDIILANLPGGNVEKVVEFRDMYLFQVFMDDVAEGDFDPFYSVNINTGEFSDFPLMGPDFLEVIDLFDDSLDDLDDE